MRRNVTTTMGSTLLALSWVYPRCNAPILRTNRPETMAEGDTVLDPSLRSRIVLRIFVYLRRYSDQMAPRRYPRAMNGQDGDWTEGFTSGLFGAPTNMTGKHVGF